MSYNLMGPVNEEIEVSHQASKHNLGIKADTYAHHHFTNPGGDIDNIPQIILYTLISTIC